MADNIAVTPGVGATVAADDISGVLFQRIKLGLGADGTAVDAVAGAGAVGTGVQRVTLASDDPAVASLASILAATDSLLLVQGGDQSFTRPSNTTAYAAGDLIANSTTAGSVTPFTFGGNGTNGFITGGICGMSASTSCTIRVHFLKTSHAVTNGDNGLLVFTSLGLANYIGYMDFDFEGSAVTAIGASGGGVAQSVSAPLSYVGLSGGNIYAFFQARTAFTPANAGTFNLRIKVEAEV